MAFLLLALILSQQPTADVDAVIARATQYVEKYEAELGNLIGTEEYTQAAVWMDNGNPPRVSKRAQRRSNADFLIIQLGTEWSALRKVTRLDGLKVKETTPSFEDAFDTSPAANSKRFEDMKKDSTQYNLGDVQREINLPTFALKVLRKDEVSRFTFERAGNARVEGVQTWKIRFREEGGRPLVTGINGEPLYSHGMLWIEPETGRILQTEIELENPYTKAGRLKGRILVGYGAGKKVDILVPKSMVEHYESRYTTIDCQAEYSNFRPFEVDVKFEINLPQP